MLYTYCAVNFGSQLTHFILAMDFPQPHHEVTFIAVEKSWCVFDLIITLLTYLQSFI